MAAKIQAIIAILILSAFALPATGLSGQGAVDKRTKIEDVESNKEVQELGKYSVNEYNLLQEQHASGGNGNGYGDLKFLKVVEAEEQVAAAATITYYLKIVAAEEKKKKMFNAEVVVLDQWKESKQLFNFAPIFTLNYIPASGCCNLAML